MPVVYFKNINVFLNNRKRLSRTNRFMTRDYNGQQLQTWGLERLHYVSVNYNKIEGHREYYTSFDSGRRSTISVLCTSTRKTEIVE